MGEPSFTQVRLIERRRQLIKQRDSCGSRVMSAPTKADGIDAAGYWKATLRELDEIEAVLASYGIDLQELA